MILLRGRLLLVLDGFRFMHTVVVYDDIDTRNPASRVSDVQQSQELTKYPIVFARAKAMRVICWLPEAAP